MKILFIHQNFPAQFRYLAPALLAQGHDVSVLTLDSNRGSFPRISYFYYRITSTTTPKVHPWVSDFETKTIRAEACYRAAVELRKGGYHPDKIVAHPGWGETLFIKQVWPDTRLGIYCEYFYQVRGADVGFDPVFLGKIK